MSDRSTLRVAVDARPEQKTQVVTLGGKLLGTASCYAMLDETRERIADGLTTVCLVMNDVALINSSGVGILASLYQSAHGRDGELVLVGLSERCLRILELTRLHEFARLADTVGDALEGSSPG